MSLDVIPGSDLTCPVLLSDDELHLVVTFYGESDVQEQGGPVDASVAGLEVRDVAKHAVVFGADVDVAFSAPPVALGILRHLAVVGGVDGNMAVDAEGELKRDVAAEAPGDLRGRRPEGRRRMCVRKRAEVTSLRF